MQIRTSDTVSLGSRYGQSRRVADKMLVGATARSGHRLSTFRQRGEVRSEVLNEWHNAAKRQIRVNTLVSKSLKSSFVFRTPQKFHTLSREAAHQPVMISTCDWQVGARGVMVIIVGNGHGDTSSKTWTRLVAFHIALIPLGKVWIQLFSLQLWVNSRTDWFLQPWWGN